MIDPTSALGAIGTNLGKEAMKPASSAADAIAGPWIARLRRWVADRDLQRRLEDPDLPNQFASYARRLGERVSAINTILAREPLAFQIVYEPLSLMTRGSDEAVPDAELRREGARTFIVDSAGMGKSTFSRHLVLQALEADDLVPVLIDLQKIHSADTLIGVIARQFDDLDKPFDRDLLLRLLMVGRFLFVFDGLDEVATENRPKLLGEIEELAVSAERSALVLTTRPETPLPLVPDARTLTIRPLTLGQAESLVKRYDRALDGIDIGERVILEFSAVPSRFLQTPLLVALLYRTFGYTHAISTRISVFYGELFDALYKGHDLTKSGFIRSKSCGLDVSQFRRLFRGFSFLAITHQKTTFDGYDDAEQVAREAEQLTSVTGASPSAFVNDLLSAVPLLLRDGREIKFVHKSVAEFFAAEFLAIGNPEVDQMTTSILHGTVFATLS